MSEWWDKNRDTAMDNRGAIEGNELTLTLITGKTEYRSELSFQYHTSGEVGFR